MSQPLTALSYLITQSLFGWKVKSADNSIIFLQLFM